MTEELSRCASCIHILEWPTCDTYVDMILLSAISNEDFDKLVDYSKHVNDEIDCTIIVRSGLKYFTMREYMNVFEIDAEEYHSRIYKYNIKERFMGKEGASLLRHRRFTWDQIKKIEDVFDKDMVPLGYHECGLLTVINNLDPSTLPPNLKYLSNMARNAEIVSPTKLPNPSNNL